MKDENVTTAYTREDTNVTPAIGVDATGYEWALWKPIPPRQIDAAARFIVAKRAAA